MSLLYIWVQSESVIYRDQKDILKAFSYSTNFPVTHAFPKTGLCEGV